MSEVSQESFEQPEDSAQESAIGSALVARVRVDYMNMIPESAWVNSR